MGHSHKQRQTQTQRRRHTNTKHPHTHTHKHTHTHTHILVDDVLRGHSLPRTLMQEATSGDVSYVPISTSEIIGWPLFFESNVLGRGFSETICSRKPVT